LSFIKLLENGEHAFFPNCDKIDSQQRPVVDAGGRFSPNSEITCPAPLRPKVDMADNLNAKETARTSSRFYGQSIQSGNMNKNGVSFNRTVKLYLVRQAVGHHVHY
jgi:hypothetical protein